MPFAKFTAFSVLACLALSACDNGQDTPTPATSVPKPTDAPVEIVLPAELAEADLVRGQREYNKCRACHTTGQGQPNRVGPNLYGIFGQPAAQNPKFRYSKPMQNSALVWDVATMDTWLASPKQAVPGTSMVFVGVRNPQRRKDLIAYLYVQTGGAQ